MTYTPPRVLILGSTRAEHESETPRNEAWHFAQELLGKAVSSSPNSFVDPECDSSDLHEWLRDISTLHEWDASKHPRGAFSQNRGWFSPTSGPSGIAKQSDPPSGSRDSQLRSLAQHAASGAFLTVGAKNAQTQRQPGQGSPRRPRPAAEAPTKPRFTQSSGDTEGSKAQSDEILAYYKVLYGDKGQALLNAFLASNGALKLDNLWLGNSALDTGTFGRPKQIRIHGELNPVEAAKELMGQLIEASGMTEVRQKLDHSGFRNIEELIASYRQSVKQAAATVAFATELYLAGISLANEGVDWVITINELSEGNLQAAIGLLPLLPASIAKTGLILKHGRQTFKISAAVVKGAKTLPIEELIELLESTRRLARNMEKAGLSRPANTAAHHIVPGGMKRFPEGPKCRQILKRFGIDVENAANGVYLPSTLEDAVKAAYHGTLHTKRYFIELHARLRRAQSKSEALEILDQVRKELLAGTFPR